MKNILRSILFVLFALFLASCQESSMPNEPLSQDGISNVTLDKAITRKYDRTMKFYIPDCGHKGHKHGFSIIADVSIHHTYTKSKTNYIDHLNYKGSGYSGKGMTKDEYLISQNSNRHSKRGKRRHIGNGAYEVSHETMLNITGKGSAPNYSVHTIFHSVTTPSGESHTFKVVKVNCNN